VKNYCTHTFHMLRRWLSKLLHLHSNFTMTWFMYGKCRLHAHQGGFCKNIIRYHGDARLHTYTHLESIKFVLWSSRKFLMRTVNKILLENLLKVSHMNPILRGWKLILGIRIFSTCIKCSAPHFVITEKIVDEIWLPFLS
jgi:hypothetical protein